jgi:hypothetical protein
MDPKRRFQHRARKACAGIRLVSPIAILSFSLAEHLVSDLQGAAPLALVVVDATSPRRGSKSVGCEKGLVQAHKAKKVAPAPSLLLTEPQGARPISV